MKTRFPLLIASLFSLGACGADEMALPEPPPPPQTPSLAAPGAPETPASQNDAGTPQNDAAADASDDAAADDAGDAGDAGPPLPALMDDPPSEEKTKAPTKAEWKSAPEYRLYKNDYNDQCKVQKLREWLRITCQGWGYAGISLVSGSRDGLDVAIQSSDSGPEGAYLVLPMRRGDRRLILFMTQSKWSKHPDFLVSEQWLSGDKGPIVSMIDM